MPAPHVTADERLSELVSHLSGAPFERSRAMVSDASSRHSGHDELALVADALLRLGCGVPAPKRNASIRSIIADG